MNETVLNNAKAYSKLKHVRRKLNTNGGASIKSVLYDDKRNYIVIEDSSASDRFKVLKSKNNQDVDNWDGDGNIDVTSGLTRTFLNSSSISTFVSETNVKQSFGRKFQNVYKDIDSKYYGIRSDGMFSIGDNRESKQVWYNDLAHFKPNLENRTYYIVFDQNNDPIDKLVYFETNHASREEIINGTQTTDVTEKVTNTTYQTSTKETTTVVDDFTDKITTTTTKTPTDHIEVTTTKTTPRTIKRYDDYTITTKSYNDYVFKTHEVLKNPSSNLSHCFENLRFVSSNDFLIKKKYPHFDVINSGFSNINSDPNISSNAAYAKYTPETIVGKNNYKLCKYVPENIPNYDTLTTLDTLTKQEISTRQHDPIIDVSKSNITRVKAPIITSTDRYKDYSVASELLPGYIIARNSLSNSDSYGNQYEYQSIRIYYSNRVYNTFKSLTDSLYNYTSIPVNICRIDFPNTIYTSNLTIKRITDSNFIDVEEVNTGGMIVQNFYLLCENNSNNIKYFSIADINRFFGTVYNSMFYKDSDRAYIMFQLRTDRYNSNGWNGYMNLLYNIFDENVSLSQALTLRGLR